MFVLKIFSHFLYSAPTFAPSACLCLSCTYLPTSVADPGSLSRIPDPDFYPSRISDPGSKNSNKREGLKKIVVIGYLFCSHKFHKIVNYFIFEMLKKKIWTNFQRIIELYTQKIVTKLSKIWVWDPGSRIQGSKRHRISDPGVKKAPDPGSRGQKGTGSRIQGSKRHRIPDPGSGSATAATYGTHIFNPV